MKKRILILIAFTNGFSGSLQLMAQLPMKIASFNLFSFTPQTSYKNTQKLYSMNSLLDAANPDFGKVAPGVNPDWYEVYSKRTTNSSSFFTENGLVINKQSYSPINYLDKNGNYVAINSKICISSNGWSATNQEYPTFLYPDASTEISLSDNERLKFNLNNSIAGHSISLNNFSVGDDGMIIHDAIPGVDKRIVFRENRIETDYLLNKPLKSLSGDLVISEEIVLPKGYSIKEKEIDGMSGIGTKRFEMVVMNANGTECAHFKIPVCYDSNKDKTQREQSFCFSKYVLRSSGGKNFLDIIVPATWLNNASRIYPITVDPLVTGPTSRWSGGFINSCFSPDFDSAMINVSVPANITITNFIVTASFFADPTNFAEERDGLFYFSTPCASSNTFSDSSYYSSGTVYLDKEDLVAQLACCYAPSCLSQTIPLSYHLSRTYGGSGCNASYIYYDPSTLYPFEAYVVGKTIESTWSVPDSSISLGQCEITINASVSNGVPPYTMTHPWAVSGTMFGSHVVNDSCISTSNGTGSLTLTIPGCLVNMCDTTLVNIPAPVIVDLCGNLVNGLVAKSVSRNKGNSFAAFSIMSDSNQLHHYLVTNNSSGIPPISYYWSWGDGTHDTIPYPSHTYADSGFYDICLTTTDSTGCQSTFCDSSFHAMRTTNTMVYVNVVDPLTTAVKEISVTTPQITLYPNPVCDMLYINNSSLTGKQTVTIYNVLGERVYKEEISNKQGIINCKPFPSGIYFVQLSNESNRWTGKFVKE